MKKITLASLSLCAALSFTGCQNSDDSSSTKDSFYTVKVNGGGVNTISDLADSEPLQIAQAIPSVSGVDYPTNLPIVFFFNDKLLISSVTEDSFIVTENGNQVSGTISVNEAANGYAILTFTPEDEFAPNASIEITLTSALQDDGGQGLSQDTTYQYGTYSTPSDNIGANEGFENGTDGIAFIGDGNIMTGSQGCMDPFAGSAFGAITTGNQLISGENAIGEASSVMILGPFDSSVSSVSFNYNFLSAEFLEFVDSEYDDSFVAVVVGQNGAYSEFITSVNIIGQNNSQCVGFPGMPDNGDDYAGSTGWTNKQINFPEMEGPVYVMFVTTDVADQIFSTVVGIDDVSFD